MKFRSQDFTVSKEPTEANTDLYEVAWFFSIKKDTYIITYYHIIYSTRSYMSPHMLIWLFIITGSYLHTSNECDPILGNKNIAQINSSNICWLFKLLSGCFLEPPSTIPPKRLPELFDLLLAARSSGRRMFHVFLSVLFYGFPLINDSLRDRLAPLRRFFEYFGGRRKKKMKGWGKKLCKSWISFVGFLQSPWMITHVHLFRVWKKV